VTRLGWIAAGLIALTLFVFITIEYFRQQLAIVMYWTAKQQEADSKRKR
jgi:hypothetical protein